MVGDNCTGARLVLNGYGPDGKAHELMLNIPDCGDQNQYRADKSIALSSYHLQGPGFFPGLDELVMAAKHDLSPSDFADYQQKVLGNSNFKQVEPGAALQYLTRVFNDIHNPDAGKELTQDELLSYLKECSPPPVLAELANWALRDTKDAHGNKVTRFQFLQEEAGNRKGLTQEDLQKLTDRFRYLTTKREPAATYLMSDLKSLESKFVPPYTTTAHPDGLTTFSLDRIANDPALPISDRLAAQSYERDFAVLKKFTGATGDQITMANLKTGEGKVQKELAAWEALETLRRAELKQFFDP